MFRVIMTFASGRPEECFTHSDEYSARQRFDSMVRGRRNLPDFAAVTLTDGEGTTLGRMSVKR